MEPFLQKPDEAYRLYNLGVAYEARGYKSAAEGDPKAAKKFFEEASINYGKAIDDKTEEKYFLEPQNRIETALAHYKKLESIAAAESAPASAPPATPSVPAGTAAGGQLSGEGSGSHLYYARCGHRACEDGGAHCQPGCCSTNFCRFGFRRSSSRFSSSGRQTSEP